MDSATLRIGKRNREERQSMTKTSTRNWRMAHAAILAACATPAFADIVEATDTGFVSTHEIEFTAPPARVFHALMSEVASWWDPAHTYSGDAANVSFTTTALHEKLADAGFVRHMAIDMARPPTTLRLRGGMGPLQPLAVAASMTFNLEPTPNGTRLHYRYVVNGPGLHDWAEPVDRVMGGQLQRLRRFVETGEPVPST